MVRVEFIEDRLAQIRTSSARLMKMQKLTKDQFIANPDYYALAEHHLRRTLESMFDIGRHIIAKKGFGKPEIYSHIFELLGQNGIISPEFSKQIKGMAGYRNRLVHEYFHITSEELYNLINTRLEDFEQFSKFLVEFLEKEHSNNELPDNNIE